MATTYTLISSNILSTNTSSITFSSIPSTYTDLVVLLTLRSGSAGTTCNITFNGDTATNYNQTNMSTTASNTINSTNSSANTKFDISQFVVGSGATANTFSSGKMYISNYLSNNQKNVFFTAHNEGNATGVVSRQASGTYNTSSAITDITFDSLGTNYVTGSSFYLYGIKNS